MQQPLTSRYHHQLPEQHRWLKPANERDGGGDLAGAISLLLLLLYGFLWLFCCRMLLLIAYIEVARIRSANAHRFFHRRALLVQNTYNLSQEIECKLKIGTPPTTIY